MTGHDFDAVIALPVEGAEKCLAVVCCQPVAVLGTGTAVRYRLLAEHMFPML